MFEQVPFPLSAQDWQGPQLALPQQVPSTQLPVRHSEPAMQATPLFFLHWLAALQAMVAAQVSASVPTVMLVQAPSDPPMLHAWQVRSQAPLQQSASLQIPLAQIVSSTPQGCPFLSLHAPNPSHALFPVQVLAGTVSVRPRPMSTQVPLAPVQAWQVGHEADPQQKPSMHVPLTHSAAPLHAVPLTFLQLPPASQLLGATQTLAGLLSVPEVMLVQVPTDPMRLHERQAVLQLLLQHTPSAQKLLTQSPTTLQPCPLIFLQADAPLFPLQALFPLQTLAGKLSVPFTGMLVQVPIEPATLQA